MLTRHELSSLTWASVEWTHHMFQNVGSDIALCYPLTAMLKSYDLNTVMYLRHTVCQRVTTSDAPAVVRSSQRQDVSVPTPPPRFHVQTDWSLAAVPDRCISTTYKENIMTNSPLIRYLG